jgi:hypothetical protein
MAIPISTLTLKGDLRYFFHGGKNGAGKPKKLLDKTGADGLFQWP